MGVGPASPGLVHLARNRGRPHVLARYQPAAARTKAISWGPPPSSSIRKEGPLSGRKIRGIFTVGGDRTEGSAGLWPSRPVAHTPAPGVQAPWRQRADYPGIQVSCWGQGSVGTPWERESAWAPRQPRENLQPWPQWLQWPPQDPAKGPGPANPGPGSPHVNTFCGHKGREATNAFTEKGVGALGD